MGTEPRATLDVAGNKTSDGPQSRVSAHQYPRDNIILHGTFGLTPQNKWTGTQQSARGGTLNPSMPLFSRKQPERDEVHLPKDFRVPTFEGGMLGS